MNVGLRTMLAACSLVPLVYGCASEGTLSQKRAGGAASVGQSIESVSWKVGDSCTFQYNHNGKKVQRVERVTEVSGGLITISVEGEGATGTKWVLDEGTYTWRVGYNLVHGTPMYADPPYKGVELPIRPGTSWSVSTIIAGTTAKGEPWRIEDQAEARAERWERVKVPAGEFMALKVTTKEREKNADGSGKPWTVTVTLWLAPEIACPIKIDLEDSFGSFGRRELISYVSSR